MTAERPPFTTRAATFSPVEPGPDNDNVVRRFRVRRSFVMVLPSIIQWTACSDIARRAPPAVVPPRQEPLFFTGKWRWKR